MDRYGYARSSSVQPSVDSTMIGNQTDYTPGNYRSIVMKYKRAKSNNAMNNLEKSIE